MSSRKPPLSAAGRPGTSYVALLRGINVGGKNSLPMRHLVTLFTDAGCVAVTTYVQSGNVVFKAAPRIAAQLAHKLAQQIEREHGLRIPIVLRTGQEMGKVLQKNPFLGRDRDTTALHVMFLDSEPGARAISSLDANRSPPDEFAVVGREIFLRCPGGLARTKLTNAYFDAKLATTATCRNWRTVLKLIELSKT